MRKKVVQEIKKPEKAEFFTVTLRACTIESTENGSIETYDLTVAQYQGKAGRQAVNLLFYIYVLTIQDTIYSYGD